MAVSFAIVCGAGQPSSYTEMYDCVTSVVLWCNTV